jgi:hypothetical protein
MVSKCKDQGISWSSGVDNSTIKNQFYEAGHLQGPNNKVPRFLGREAVALVTDKSVTCMQRHPKLLTSMNSSPEDIFQYLMHTHHVSGKLTCNGYTSMSKRVFSSVRVCLWI